MCKMDMIQGYGQDSIQGMIQDMCKICTSDVIDNIQEHQWSIGKEWMDDGEWVDG